MEIGRAAKLDTEKYLRIDEKLVSLFYFRAGYTEKDYVDEVRCINSGMLESKRIN